MLSSRAALVPLVLVAALAACVIAAHAWLIAMGHWQGDEYLCFGRYRQLGVRFLLARLGGWSPRPASELLLYLYARCVLALRLPLIPAVLGVCWGALLAALASARWSGIGPAARAALTLALFAMFLLAPPSVSEMFYWPMAAVAYLLCLAGVSLAVLRLADAAPIGRGARVTVIGALLLAAGSAEVGLFFVICLCPLLALAERRTRGAWMWLLPLLLALPLLVLVALGRVSAVEPVWGAQVAIFHHPGAAVRAGLAALPGALADGGRGWMLAAEAAFASGLFMVLRTRPAPMLGPRRLALAAALLGTIVLSIVTAEYALGSLCCERHQSFRQCLMLLLLVVLAGWAAAAWPGRGTGQASASGGMLLAAALWVALAPRAPGLLHDTGLRASVLRIDKAGWRSGIAAGTDAMTLARLPPGSVVRTGLDLPPGLYLDGTQQPWSIRGLLQFFGKRRLTVLPAQ